VGVGGVTDATTAVELLLAGASAVQVGTATFADPRAPGRVRDELERWAVRHGVPRIRDVIGEVHG
jgi:dihydroorotate dehydrogenase (NAD+) catalytic subunit